MSIFILSVHKGISVGNVCIISYSQTLALQLNQYHLVTWYNTLETTTTSPGRPPMARYVVSINEYTEKAAIQVGRTKGDGVLHRCIQMTVLTGVDAK